MIHSANIQQLNVIAFSIQTALTNVQTGYTYFQAPVKVEDALGFVFPFPSELSFSDLKAVFQSRFQGKPGQQQVEAGEYEVSVARNSKQILGSDSVGLYPGMSVVMAIIVTRPDNICPNRGCMSTDSVPACDGGRR